MAACASGPRTFLKRGFIPPPRIAVLPLTNQTDHPDGPEIVRAWFDLLLAEQRGYRTIPLEKIDENLKKMGIQKPEQLEGIPTRHLGALLSAEALVYGELIEFVETPSRLTKERKVQARFTMLDTETGEPLWEAEGVGTTSKYSPQNTERAESFTSNLALPEKAMNSPLKPEIWAMIKSLLQNLPNAK